MGEIVAAFGVPHTPNFPALVAKQGPDCRTAKLYAEIAKHLHAAAPDVLLIYTDDHFNTFFLDNFPTFAIGIADQTCGPNDQTAMPSYRVEVDAGALASHVRAEAIGDGFDVSLAQDVRARSLHHGAAAFSHPGHEGPDRPVASSTGLRRPCRARSAAMRWARRCGPRSTGGRKASASR